MPLPATPSPNLDVFLADARHLIESARSRAATAVNAEHTLLYWHLGKRIRKEIVGSGRADYGEQAIPLLANHLLADYGKGFSRPNLFRMLMFFDRIPQENIVSTLSRQLSWSHFVEILPLKDPLQREFYATLAAQERWPVRTLRERIGSMLFERTAIANKPEEVIQGELANLRDCGIQTPDLVFRDPYILDFTGLQGSYSEKDLESALVRELESFLLELGSGFSFVARQKRITVGKDDFYLDLLFFHRGLRRLVAIELKLDGFRPENKGQMELYLRWLDRYERQPHEESPLGILLCASADREQVELLEMHGAGIRVAEYLTQLPPRDVLLDRFHRAIQASRNMPPVASLPEEASHGHEAR